MAGSALDGNGAMVLRDDSNSTCQYGILNLDIYAESHCPLLITVTVIIYSSCFCSTHAKLHCTVCLLTEQKYVDLSSGATLFTVRDPLSGTVLMTGNCFSH